MSFPCVLRFLEWYDVAGEYSRLPVCRRNGENILISYGVQYFAIPYRRTETIIYFTFQLRNSFIYVVCIYTNRVPVKTKIDKYATQHGVLNLN
jgi:hypothetical protein